MKYKKNESKSKLLQDSRKKLCKMQNKCIRLTGILKMKRNSKNQGFYNKKKKQRVEKYGQSPT